MFPESPDSIHYRNPRFPGCIGSIDCVYFFGIAVLRTTHSVQGKGKEKAPANACLAISHTKKFYLFQIPISVVTMTKPQQDSMPQLQT